MRLLSLVALSLCLAGLSCVGRRGCLSRLSELTCSYVRSADIFSKSSKPDKAQTSWKAGEP